MYIYTHTHRLRKLKILGQIRSRQDWSVALYACARAIITKYSMMDGFKQREQREIYVYRPI